MAVYGMTERAMIATMSNSADRSFLRSSQEHKQDHKRRRILLLVAVVKFLSRIRITLATYRLSKMSIM
jgi:hypothetical protein